MYVYAVIQDVEATGIIDLEADSFVRDERDKDKRRKFMFSVGTSRRVFFIHSDTEAEMNQWTAAIKANIDRPSTTGTITGAGPTGNDGTARPPDGQVGGKPTGFTPPPTPSPDAPPRARMAAAKNCIPYLLEVCSYLSSHLSPSHSLLVSNTNICKYIPHIYT